MTRQDRVETYTYFMIVVDSVFCTCDKQTPDAFQSSFDCSEITGSYRPNTADTVARQQEDVGHEISSDSSQSCVMKCFCR